MGSDPVTVSKEVFKNISRRWNGQNSRKISERRCKSIGSSIQKFNRFINIILSVFSGEGNIAKLNPVFKKGATADPKKL